MAAIDAISLQAGLREGIRTDTFLRFLRGFRQNMHGAHPYGAVLFPYEAEEHVRRSTGYLSTAMTYHVAEQMTVVTEWAAQGLPEETTLSREDLPADLGFLVFEDPIIEYDPNNQPMENKALLWYLGSMHNFRTGADDHGVWVDIYSSTEDCLDQWEHTYNTPSSYDRKALRYVLGPLMPLNRTFIPFNRAIGAEKIPASAATGLGGWEFAKVQALAAGLPEPTVANNTRWITALFHLLNQKITDVSEATLPAKVRTSFKKKRVPGMVTTVRLRVISGINPTEGESLTEWSRRWVVRGHWRRQPYGSRTDPDYRMVWIAPHIKGPEGMPLVVPDKVYTLTR